MKNFVLDRSLKYSPMTLNCFICEHQMDEKYDDFCCAAFPDGIPEDILTEKIQHNKPLPDQKNDIVFEEAK